MLLGWVLAQGFGAGARPPESHWWRGCFRCVAGRGAAPAAVFAVLGHGPAWILLPGGSSSVPRFSANLSSFDEESKGFC